MHTLGKFELVDRIGLGGMATVHRAYERGPSGLKREVVVKQILPELCADETIVQMFLDEARLVSKLSHPNIVQVFDLGAIDDRYFMSMEYVDGLSLLHLAIKYRARQAVLEPEIAVYIALQVCIALAYIHTVAVDGENLGIVHRDVSPANIVISKYGEVKVLDFGVSKLRASDQRQKTRVGTLKGKLGYMSPEQVQSGYVDSRSDLFVVGILLWEMLAGRRLFKAASDYLTLRQVVRVEVPPLSDVREGLPAPLIALIDRALARDPDQRYQRAGEMIADLEVILLDAVPVGPRRLASIVTSLQKSATSTAAELACCRENAPRLVADGGEDFLKPPPLPSRTAPSPLVAAQNAAETSVERSLAPVITEEEDERSWSLPAFLGGALATLAIALAVFMLVRAPFNTHRAQASDQQRQDAQTDTAVAPAK